MLRLTEIKLPLTHSEDDLKAVILKRLAIADDELLGYVIFKRGVDARKSHAILYTYTLDVTVGDEAAILALPLEIRLDPVPSVRFRSLRGSRIECVYGQTPKLNGTAINYGAWPLFGGPFLEADVDSERLTIKYGSMRRTLDFRNLTVVDGGK